MGCCVAGGAPIVSGEAIVSPGWLDDGPASGCVDVNGAARQMRV